jgi:hypothetical protein
VIGVALAIFVAAACVTVLVIVFMDTVDGVDGRDLLFGAVVGVLLTLSLLHLTTVLT